MDWLTGLAWYWWAAVIGSYRSDTNSDMVKGGVRIWQI